MVNFPAKLATARKSGLISPDDLLEVLETAPERVKLVDATYPSNPSLPAIGNAQVFDIDDIADPNSPMPHMLPSPELFAAKVGALGIGNNDFVITYDQSGIVMAAARAWWMFRVFGHDNVAVLDGGLMDWLRKNHPVSQTRETPVMAEFIPQFRPQLVMSYDDMKFLSASKSAEILDARPPGRFVDHIPNSKNIPALELMDASRHMIDAAAFREQLSAQNISTDSPLVATCGSGVTACVIALALFREGHDKTAVYDGSWTEWSSRMA